MLADSNPFGWTLGEFEAWAASLGHRPYRARQAASWILSRGKTDPSVMTSLPAELRASLADDCRPVLPKVVASRESVDGSRKFLLEMSDGERVEMVLMPEGRRTTLCFSTQVGCPIGCLFCRTGRGGLVRNLASAEIVGQVVLARALAGGGKAVTNLVVMGMGEPLLNFEAVTRALDILTAPWGLGIPPRRITLSTAGVTPLLVPLRRRFPALNLAVSLNAPEAGQRERLMPGTRNWPLGKLLQTVFKLPGRSRHPVTIEYILLAGVNDRPEHAGRLAGLLRGRRVQVNLIAFNPVPGSGYAPPDPGTVIEFKRVLHAHGVRVMVRQSRGADIQAACGQLRAEA